MANEYDNTIKALKLAIQMEINGKDFYEKASNKSIHQVGKQLFLTLASEEDLHRQKFKEIYDLLSTKKGWPNIEPVFDKGKTIKTIFNNISRDIVKSDTSELEAIGVGVEIEERSIEVYSNFSKVAGYPAERVFYEALVGEERGHRLALLDYKEYLENPAGWFVEKEHHSLDGG